MKADDYKKLSSIAPTIAQTAEYDEFGMPRQEQTLMIGRALGREALAQQLLKQVDIKIAQIRDRHPQFVGATAVLAGPMPNGQYGIAGAQDPRVRVLASMGFKPPSALANSVENVVNYFISREQVALLDADVVLWNIATPDQREAIETDALYRQTKVAKEGRAIFSMGDELLRGALGFSTVLSLQFAIDAVVPRLEAAIDGDLATTQ
jgi:iron complex transport system substrate-binding protein